MTAAKNPTIARLDRLAKKLGVVSYRERGGNVREFTLPSGRLLKFQPGGKGVIRVRALVWVEQPGEWTLDSECVVSLERAERLLYQSATIALGD